jgi:hypothetical protein
MSGLPHCQWRRIAGAHPFTWKPDCKPVSGFYSQPARTGERCVHCTRPVVASQAMPVTESRGQS